MTSEVMAVTTSAVTVVSMTATADETFQRPVGELLRGWRERRRLSQLDLANQVEVSTRHVSFVETGRSKPSREMVLRLAEHLDVPLRDRNQLLLAGGYAPIYSEASLHSPAMLAIREALRRLLKAHEPYPALVVDRWWNIVEANAGIQLFTDGVAAELLKAPINALRLTLHPDGLAGRITNLPRGPHAASWPACTARSPVLRTRNYRTCTTSCAGTPAAERAEFARAGARS